MNPAAAPDTPAAAPHSIRQAAGRRLQDRFLRAGREAVDERELLELLLSARPSVDDAEALAASLLDLFGSAPRVLAARPDRLRTVPGLPEDAIAALKAAEALGIRMARAEIPEKVGPTLGSYDKVIEYCRALAGRREVEEFHILYLNLCAAPKYVKSGRRRRFAVGNRRHQLHISMLRAVASI